MPHHLWFLSVCGDLLDDRAADDHPIGNGRDLGSVLWRRNPEADRDRDVSDFPDFLDVLTHIGHVEQFAPVMPVSDT